MVESAIPANYKNDVNRINLPYQVWITHTKFHDPQMVTIQIDGQINKISLPPSDPDRF